jgi:hypothetical protein
LAGVSAHPGQVPDAAYDDGVLLIVPVADGPPGVVLAGEIDEQNRAALAAALGNLAAGHRQFYVDMAAVSYCDLAGLRMIMRLGGGEDPSQPGPLGQPGEVVLVRVPGYLQQIMRIVGWDRRPGISLRPPGRPAGKPPPLA